MYDILKNVYVRGFYIISMLSYELYQIFFQNHRNAVKFAVVRLNMIWHTREK